MSEWHYEVVGAVFYLQRLKKVYFRVTTKPTMTSTVMIQTDVGSVEIVTCSEIFKKTGLLIKYCMTILIY